MTAQPSFVVDAPTAGDDSKVVAYDLASGTHKYVRQSDPSEAAARALHEALTTTAHGGIVSELEARDPAQLVGPLDPRLMTTVFNAVANYAYGVRWRISRTGTLTDIAIGLTGGAAGHVDVGVYDTTVTTRNRLFHSGSVVTPSTGTWQIVASAIGLTVNRGDEVDLVVQFDVAAQIACASPTQLTGLLPATFWPSLLGGVAKITWQHTTIGSFGLPATLAESALDSSFGRPAAIIARIA